MPLNPRITVHRRESRPFIEAKEGIGGFAIVDVPDEATVIAMAKEWANIGRGFPPHVQEAHWTIEVRPVTVRDQG